MLEEHDAIVSALLSHEREEAVQAMTRHIQETAMLASAAPQSSPRNQADGERGGWSSS